MKFKIKMVYLVDDEEYCVFCEELGKIEGRGSTEQEAMDDFKYQYDRKVNEQ